MDLVMVFCLAVGLASLWAGSVIGRRKGRPAAGFFWPFFLGPIGVLVVAALPDARAQDRSFDAAEREEWQQLKADLQRARNAAADGGSSGEPFIPYSMRQPVVPRRNFERRR